jgi:hypothetical protein
MFALSDNQSSINLYDRRLVDAAIEAEARAFFASYVDEWVRETEWHSSISAITHHRRFRDIVNIGAAAAKIILQRMNEGDIRIHWFPVLKEITAEDPVPIQERGRVALMSNRWIEWGRERGYIES